MTFYDTCSENDGTVKKYGLVAKSSASHNTHLGYGSIDSTITVQEIKQ